MYIAKEETRPPNLSKFLRESDFALVAKAEEEIRRASKIDLDTIDIDTASDFELRLVVKELMKLRTPPPPEPVGIDLYSHLPVFLDRAECTRCAQFIEPQLNPETGLRHYICHDCKGFIPHSVEFQNRGIASVTIDHLHMHAVLNGGGREIRVPADRELCLPCFRKDWHKKFPDKPCDL